MIVINMSTDRKIFKKDSSVRQRMVDYGNLFEELHIVIFSLKKNGFQNEKISSNVFIYPTNSVNHFFYIFDGIKIGKRILSGLKNKKEIVISTQDPFETGIVGAWFAKKFKIPFQIQIHTDFLNPFFITGSFLNRIRVFIAKFLLPRADGIRVVSSRISSSIKTKGYKLKTIPIVLPIYVDIEKIKNTPITVNLQKKYPQFDFIILMASRLEKEKNIPLVLKAFSEVIKKYPKTGLIIVGSGSFQQFLKLKVKSCGLEASVIFEPWINDLVSYYKTADLFLLSSNYEGYGLSLIEAAISECPIISTDVGLIGEIITKQEAGICAVGDQFCFTQEIIKTIENRELIKKRAFFVATQVMSKLIKNKSEYLKQYYNSLKINI